MTQSIYRIQYNQQLTADVWEMRLEGDTGAITAPGQFINIRLDGLFLRRPISVCDWDGQGITIIYKVVGKGTAALGGMEQGQELGELTIYVDGEERASVGLIAQAAVGKLSLPQVYQGLLGLLFCPT